MLEQALKSRMLDYFESNKMFTECQFGFRKNMSTEMAIRKTIYYILEALDRSQKCLVASATFLASVSAGAGLGYPSVLLFQLGKNDTAIEIDLDSVSWIGSVHGFAGILSIIMPAIMQWKGRKVAFITSSAFVFVGWIVIYFSNSISTILISESLQGFGGNGLFTVSYLSLSEMVTPEYRNVFIQCYNICQCLGLALISTTIKTLHWRLVGLVFGAPLVAAIVIAFMWPESPSWLAWKGKVNECENSFIWLRGNGEKSSRELKELIAAQKENRQRDQKTKMIKKIYSDITTNNCYIPGLHMLLLFTLTYFSGGMVIILYSVELIRRTAHDENLAFIGAMSLNILLLLGVSTNGVLVKRFKNKTVVLTSAFGSTISLLLASMFTYLQTVEVLAKESQLCLYCLLGFAITGNSSMMPTACTISAELMPVRYRGIGGCLSMFCTCILHAFMLKTAPYLFLYIGLHGTFLLYSCNITIFAILVWKFIPETKNRTLQEIENFYTYGKFESRLVISENEQTNMLI